MYVLQLQLFCVYLKVLYVIYLCIFFVDSVLWKHLSPNGVSLSANTARLKLHDYFDHLEHSNQQSSTRRMTVLLIDEIDYIQTKDEKVLYDFSNWPLKANSKLFVIGVANAIDLVERYIGRTTSRTPVTAQNRIVFAPYPFNAIQSMRVLLLLVLLLLLLYV